jgi:oligoribonuclease NrnB/cAMP/cGMP phosphodiesterase (DHH superfamily)
MGLTRQENETIRQELLSAENPFFLFHDDPDGLASYILLKKFKGSGRGMMVKAEPNVNDRFLPPIKAVKPDAVFVLDVALMQQSFVDTILSPIFGVRNIIWIDHHQPSELRRVKYFNPRVHLAQDNPPVSYLCYEIVNKPSDLWLAMTGIVSDWHMPDFAGEFIKEYPDLLPKMMTAEEAMFTTNIGKLGRILSFMLKGPTSEAVACIRALEKINSPYEILNRITKEGKFISNKYQAVYKEYEQLLNQAKAQAEDQLDKKFLIFTYHSQQSFSGDLSNELLFLYPDMIIVVGRERPEQVMLSFRARNTPVLKPLLAALKGIEGYGGGHENACGGAVKKEQFEKFIKKFKEQF